MAFVDHYAGVIIFTANSFQGIAEAVAEVAHNIAAPHGITGRRHLRGRAFTRQPGRQPVCLSVYVVVNLCALSTASSNP